MPELHTYQDLEGQELPVLREAFADRRRIFDGLGIAAGVLQQMHPEINAATIDQQSEFLSDPWGRIMRSVVQIDSTLSGGNREQSAMTIRGYHSGLNGTYMGQEYDALKDETFMWPLMTFRYMIEERLERDDSLSDDTIRQLNEEWIAWALSYGIEENAIPKTREEHRERFDDICTTTLEMTEVARSVFAQMRDLTLARPPFIPAELWRKKSVRRGFSDFLYVTTVSGLPPIVRQRFADDLPWGPMQSVQNKSLHGTFRMAWMVTPEAARYSSSLRREVLCNPGNAFSQLIAQFLDFVNEVTFEER